MVQIFSVTSLAEGAIPNGTRIVKVKTEKDDANPVGTKGKVMGSITLTPHIGYFVEWETLPGVPVFVVDWKIAREQ